MSALRTRIFLAIGEHQYFTLDCSAMYSSAWPRPARLCLAWMRRGPQRLAMPSSAWDCNARPCTASQCLGRPRKASPSHAPQRRALLCLRMVGTALHLNATPNYLSLPTSSQYTVQMGLCILGGNLPSRCAFLLHPRSRA